MNTTLSEFNIDFNFIAHEYYNYMLVTFLDWSTDVKMLERRLCTKRYIAINKCSYTLNAKRDTEH